VATEEEMFFKVKPGVRMSKVMQAYADRKGVGLETMRFLLDGRGVRVDDTVESLEMDDGDQLDAMVQSLGC
jgi:small ubiquitin-related modifier